MYTVDLVLRFAAISQLVLIAVILVKDHRGNLSGILVAPFALSVVCYLLAAPALRYWQWGAWSYPLLAGASTSPVLFWLLARSLFEDSFRFRSYHVFVLLIVSLVVFGTPLLSGAGVIRGEATDRGVVNFMPLLVSQLLVFAFVFLGLFTAIKDWRTDLVESRRRFRFVLLVTTGSYMVIIACAKLILVGAGKPPPITVQTLNAAIIFVMVFFFNAGLLGLRTGFLVAPVHKSRVLDEPSDTRSAAIEDLQRLLKDERVFSQQNLTIRKLAEKLGQQEHKLRRLINTYLGHRNFNDFLNHYRIAEATQRLTHPDSRHLPVLTIAMDVGYHTLAPFNKAFKKIHGVTPTEYRKSKTQSPDLS